MLELKDVLNAQRRCTNAKKKETINLSRECKETAKCLISGIIIDSAFDTYKKSPSKKKKKIPPFQKSATTSDESGDEYFEVDRVIDTKLEGGRRYYFVTWKGYDESEWSWEPKSGLALAQSAIKAFQNRQGEEDALLTHEERKENERQRLKELAECPNPIENNEQAKEDAAESCLPPEMSKNQENESIIKENGSRDEFLIQKTKKQKYRRVLVSESGSADSTPSKKSRRSNSIDTNMEKDISLPSSSMSIRHSENSESRLSTPKIDLTDCYRSASNLSNCSDFTIESLKSYIEPKRIKIEIQPLPSISNPPSKDDKRERASEEEKSKPTLSSVKKKAKKRKRRQTIIPRDLRSTWSVKKEKAKQRANLKADIDKLEQFFNFEEDSELTNAFEESDEYDPENIEISPELLTNLNTINNAISNENNESLQSCEFCTFSTSDAVILKKHMSLQHLRGIIYICPICSAAYNWNKNFYEHLVLHFEGFVYKCNTCEHSTEKIHEYLSHRISHTKEKIHKCNECDSQFTFRQNLIQHRFFHSGEKPFECNRCAKKFAFKSNFIQHQSKHIESKPKYTKRHRCIVCKTDFFRFNTYMKHLRKEHPTEALPESLQCSYCDMEFMDGKNFQYHENLHRDGKLFICTVCRKRKFPNKEIFEKHMEEHKNATNQQTICQCSHITDEIERTVFHSTICLMSQVTVLDERVSQTTSTLNPQTPMQKPSEFNCRYCSFSTEFGGVYERHLKRKHSILPENLPTIVQTETVELEDSSVANKFIPVTIVDIRGNSNEQSNQSITGAGVNALECEVDDIEIEEVSTQPIEKSTNSSQPKTTKNSSIGTTKRRKQTFMAAVRTLLPHAPAFNLNSQAFEKDNDYGNLNYSTQSPTIPTTSSHNRLTIRLKITPDQPLRCGTNSNSSQNIPFHQPINVARSQPHPYMSNLKKNFLLQHVNGLKKRCLQCVGCQLLVDCKKCVGCTESIKKKIGCIMRLCLTALEHHLKEVSFSLKKRTGCNQCKVCQSNGCQTCLVCLDKRFFDNHYLAGCLCFERNCLIMNMDPSNPRQPLRPQASFSQNLPKNFPFQQRLSSKPISRDASPGHIRPANLSTFSQYPVGTFANSGLPLNSPTLATSTHISFQYSNFGVQQRNTAAQIQTVTPRVANQNSITISTNSNLGTLGQSSSNQNSVPNTPSSTPGMPTVKLEPEDSLVEKFANEFKIVCKAIETLPIWVPAQNAIVLILKGHMYTISVATPLDKQYSRTWRCHQSPICPGEVKVNETILQLFDQLEPKIAYEESCEHIHFNDPSLVYNALSRYITNRWALKNGSLTASEIREAILSNAPQGSFVAPVQTIAKELETLRNIEREFFAKVDNMNWRALKKIN